MKLESGQIDPTLPFIKREAEAVLSKDYADVETATTEIRRSLESFYEKEDSQVWETRNDAVERTIDSVCDIYRKNFFPAMKVNWSTYPDNIGHLYSPGCFRCHDGRHVNQQGDSISAECSTCHTFFNPVEGQKDTFVEGAFRHAMSLEVHDSLRCNDCHTGGVSPSCLDCHDEEDLEDEL